MADLKAKRVLGSNYTSTDKLELELTYTGDAQLCVNSVEVVSGIDVTHGGGSPAATTLHYKSASDANADGVIDYSSSFMNVVQVNKGTSVIKAVASVMLQNVHDAWETENNTWMAANSTVVDGNTVINEGSDYANAPTYPSPTIYKSGEITLVWSDDTLV